MSESPADFLTVDEAAAAVRVTRGCVEKWIRTGVLIQGRRVRLAATRVGSRYRLTREGIAAFVSACNPDPVRVPTTAADAARQAARDREDFDRLARGR